MYIEELNFDTDLNYIMRKWLWNQRSHWLLYMSPNEISGFKAILAWCRSGQCQSSLLCTPKSTLDLKWNEAWNEGKMKEECYLVTLSITCWMLLFWQHKLWLTGGVRLLIVPWNTLTQPHKPIIAHVPGLSFERCFSNKSSSNRNSNHVVAGGVEGLFKGFLGSNAAIIYR